MSIDFDSLKSFRSARSEMCKPVPKHRTPGGVPTTKRLRWL
jgi:hypothetical protein